MILSLSIPPGNVPYVFYHGLKLVEEAEQEFCGPVGLPFADSWRAALSAALGVIVWLSDRSI